MNAIKTSAIAAVTLAIAGAVGTNMRSDLTTVHLQWEASPEAKTYNLYARNSLWQIPTKVPLGGLAKAIYKVPHKTIYYFYVTALDSNKIESVPSNTVCYTNL
jgi:hypothetical protein